MTNEELKDLETAQKALQCIDVQEDVAIEWGLNWAIEALESVRKRAFFLRALKGEAT